VRTLVSTEVGKVKVYWTGEEMIVKVVPVKGRKVEWHEDSMKLVVR